uniref:C2H2-type domain-containing protein n=1 Tax=Esox lucius TaxID=8010 RepID=A0AAY5K8K6_ESOLU
MEARRRQESDHPVAAEANAPQTSTIELDTCNLKQHRESVDKDEKLKLVLKCEARKVVFKCGDCGKDFKCSSSLRTHKRIHSPFYCSDCGRVLPNSIAFERHKLVQHKEIQCTMCEKTFTLTKLQLNSHIEQVHEEVRYPCTICGKQFYKSVSLKRHKLTHTGERPWPCSYCTKTFITANERRLHERYHTGERPYKCQDCGKSFIQSGYLKSHRSLHTGEKPFACSICDKRFRLSYHRVKHERTHTKQNKLHVCGECGLAFAQRKSMRRHQQSHAQNHDLKFKCLKCGFCFKDLYDLKNHQQGVCERELHILDNNEVEDIQHPSTSKPVLTSPLKSPAPPELLPRKVLDTKTCSLCGSDLCVNLNYLTDSLH